MKKPTKKQLSEWLEHIHKDVLQTIRVSRWGDNHVENSYW
jgi:hypothetical protein